ncbi:MAG: FliA/WhiG family RNA polymerase sigma factor [Acidimicrobiales bacterium]
MTELADTANLWDAYKRTSDKDLQRQLVLHYASLVKYVAARVATGLPATVEQGDLVSYGMFGLIDAIEKFELERGFKFETYAIPRIRGAILDELRSMDWVPRSVRAKARRIEQAMAGFENDEGRSPSEEELAERCGLSLNDLRSTLGQIARGGILGLDEMMSGGTTEGISVGDTVADDTPGPGGQYEASEIRQLLAASILALPDRERTVLGLYYYETMTLAEIGSVLGVSESRVCQIHGKAVLQLRSRLLAATRDV